VSLKLLLDAARGLAYMHDVDVVHGDVKSRNLLVFWEEDDEDQQQQQLEGKEAGGAEGAAEGALAAAAGSEQQQQEQQLQRSSSSRPPVWGLKWCDFGVSFRAAEAPNGILKTVGGPGLLWVFVVVQAVC
jgi:serine/threonine protein kinase